MSFEQNIRSYLACFNGSTKDFSQVEHLFDALYDDSFISIDGDDIVNKQQMKQLHKGCLELGSRATVINVQKLAASSCEYKFRMTNKKFDIVIQCNGKVRNGRLVEARRISPSEGSDPVPEARSYLLHRYEDLKQSRGVYDLIKNMRAYESLVNDKQSTVEDIERSVDTMFHEDFVGDEPGCGPNKADAKRLILKDFADVAQIHFEKMEVIDDSHIEIVITKENEWRRHQVLTVKQAKIVKLDTISDIEDLVYYLNKYAEVQNSADRSTLQDMEDVFERIFHEDFVGDEPGCGPRKKDAKKIVFKDFVEGSKIVFEKIEVIDESHLDIIISKKGDWRRNQILTVKDGKMARIDTVKDGEEPKAGSGLSTSYPVPAQ